MNIENGKESLSAPSWRIPVPLWMCIVALALRLIVLFTPSLYHAVTAGYQSYQNEATNIAASLYFGHGFASPFGGQTGPTAWVAPVYPLLLEGWFKLLGLYSGGSLYAILIMQCVLSAATCWPIYSLSQYLIRSRAAQWPGWIWAVLPFFFRWPLGWIWEVSLSALLLTWLVVMCIRLTETESLVQWLLYGAVWGFTALTNTALIASMPLLLLYPAWRIHKRSRMFMRPFLLALLCFLLVIAPWIIRNRLVIDRSAGLRSNFWAEFWMGNASLRMDFNEIWKHPTIDRNEFQRYAELGEVQYAKEKRSLSIAIVGKDPAGFMRLTLQRIFYYWEGTPLMYLRDTEWWRPSKYGFPLLSITGLLGAGVALWRGAPGSLPMAIPLLFHPIVFYLVFVTPRYRHPIEPLLLIFSLYLFSQAEWKAQRNRAAA